MYLLKINWKTKYIRLNSFYYFNNDGAQLYLIFQPIYTIIATFSGLPNIISVWGSNGLSNEKFWSPYTTNEILSPKLQWNKYKLRLGFEGSCLKEEDIAPVIANNIVNLSIVHELDSWPPDLDTEFTLVACFFGGANLTKNDDQDEYSYGGYDVGLDTRGYHSLPDSSVGKNVIILGVDMSSSLHIDNMGKDIWIFGKGPTQGLNHTLTAETQYSINFTRPDIKFCLVLHWNGSNSFLFVNAATIYQLKAKDSETK